MKELSVIFTTYNEKRNYLIESIESILNQTFKNFRLIIVIEPNDINCDIIKEYEKKDSRVLLIFNKSKQGFVKSLNIGLQYVNTEYIARMDSDDICSLFRFEKQLTFLKNNQDISVLGTNLEIIDENSIKIDIRSYPKSHKEIRDKFFITNAIAHPSVMFKKHCIDNFGLYNENFQFSEDLEIWLRFLKNGCKFANINEQLVKYRVRDKSELRTKEHWKFNYLARKLHSFSIWNPFQATLSMVIFFFLINFSDKFIKYLLNLRIVYRLKGKKY